MNKKFLLAIFSFLFTITIVAQPPASAVIKRLTHTGVVKVELVKTVKEWKDGKYIYVAYANVIKAVAPEKVFGLKGVTLVIATMAYYDLGASQPYQVLGSESNGEYRGINLPIPSNAELTKFATDLAQKNPEKFFIQAYSIVAVEKITVAKPNAVWLHPGKLQFEGTMVYVDRLTKETFQRIEAPCTMELHRESLTAPWYLGKGSANRMQERYVGDIIHAADAPQWANLTSLSERAAEATNKEKMAGMGFTAPPVFATPKELMMHVHEKLLNMPKEQFKEYIKLLYHSMLKPQGSVYSVHHPAQQEIDKAVSEAYDGWGKYKDQYCIVPGKLEEIGQRVQWYNKNNTSHCQLLVRKDGNTYGIEYLILYLDKTPEADAAFKAINCITTTTPSTPSTTSATTHTSLSFKKGDKVLVEEDGKWYPATVLDTRPGEWYIHYDGYSSQYDLWVGPSRIKSK